MIFLVRVLPRALALALLTFTATTVILLARPLRPVAPRLQLALRNTAFRFWGRNFSRLVGMRIRVEGEPPRGAFFLVANHLSYMDILLLASQVDAAFVAKADLRGWPLLGWVFANADTIFIDRGRRRDVVRVMGAAGDQLERGLGVVLFPEGTSSRGAELLRFKPSLLELPAQRDLPVAYACLSYRTRDTDPHAENAVCWWGDAPFLPHFLGLLRLPSFEATLRFGNDTLHDTDRKALATKLRDAMSEEFTPSAEDVVRPS